MLLLDNKNLLTGIFSSPTMNLKSLLSSLKSAGFSKLFQEDGFSITLIWNNNFLNNNLIFIILQIIYSYWCYSFRFRQSSESTKLVTILVIILMCCCNSKSSVWNCLIKINIESFFLSFVIEFHYENMSFSQIAWFMKLFFKICFI